MRAAADYLATRRAMGYKLAYQGQMLAQFVAYLDAVGAEHLTIRHAVGLGQATPGRGARVVGGQAEHGPRVRPLPQRAGPGHRDSAGRA